MLHLDENERIDWFRIIADLKRAGVSIVRVSKDLDIPKSTIQGWTQEIGNPRLEPGLRLIEFWARTCKKKIKEVPRYNPFKPYPPPAPVSPKVQAEKKPPPKPTSSQMELNI